MTIIEKIIAKHQEDREVIREMKRRHTEELRVVEEFQAKREAALLEHADMTAFGYLTDLYINGRDGKAATEKAKENISLSQAKIEAWLLKMLTQIGEGIKTEFGTVYKTRKESVTCADFEMFCRENMLKDAAGKVVQLVENLTGDVGILSSDDVLRTIYENMHLELLTKAVRKESVLELMGEPNKDGSRPNTPPAGVNYTAIQCVGVRKAK